MRLGKRFESARRLSRFGVDKPNTRQWRSCRSTREVRLHHPYITEMGSLPLGDPGGVRLHAQDDHGRLQAEVTLGRGQDARLRHRCRGVLREPLLSGRPDYGQDRQGRRRHRHLHNDEAVLQGGLRARRTGKKGLAGRLRVARLTRHHGGGAFPPRHHAPAFSDTVRKGFERLERPFSALRY